MNHIRVHFHLLRVGQCRHYEWAAIRGGSWKKIAFPAICALIGHPTRGWMLYDTGYSERFFEETKPFPERLYRMMLPVDLSIDPTLEEQLAKLSIRPENITTILVSHFHGDHVAGLRNFPRAKFWAMKNDFDRAMGQSRWRGTFDGFLRGLLPADFESRVSLVETARCVALPAWLAPFTSGFDLFGDGSLIAVPLPGHAASQMGLVFRDENDVTRFLIADACWSLPACRAGRPPSLVASLFFADRLRYRKTFIDLQTLAQREKNLCLIPSHCETTWNLLEPVLGLARLTGAPPCTH